MLDYFTSSASRGPEKHARRQILAVTVFVRELRLLSAVVNSLLLGTHIDSESNRCIAGIKVDENIVTMLNFPHHTHQTRRVFASIMTLSLCEAQLHGAKLRQEEKKIISYVAKTLKLSVEQKLAQYKEQCLNDEENMIEESLSWSIVPALGLFIKYTSFLWPEKALWGVNILIDHWTTLYTIQAEYEKSLNEPLYLYYRYGVQKRIYI